MAVNTCVQCYLFKGRRSSPDLYSKFETPVGGAALPQLRAHDVPFGGLLLDLGLGE